MGDELARRTVVFGATGQVGRALLARLGGDAIGLSRGDADFAQPESIPAALDRHAPALVINAAAYTNVERAELEPEVARRINAEAPGFVARWCARRGVPLVHYSTDYVFDGSGTRPHEEADPVAPLNTYGRTKLEGERAVVEAGGPSLIFRTSWVYADEGRSFVTTMLRLGRSQEIVRVVSDQIGAPTFAADLAAATLDAVHAARAKDSFPSGVYQVCNDGETSWHGFAEAIFEEATRRGIVLRVARVEPIASREWPTRAARPRNSRLSTRRAREILGVTLPHWRDALGRCTLR